MSGASDATVWEFKGNGAVLVGDVSGRYKFGDQDRIKIETPFATTVYQVKISGDQMVLQEPGGSKLEFMRIRETRSGNITGRDAALRRPVSGARRPYHKP